ncbi:VRR-NUC domain-containing protein [Burkholderia sp. 9777_1386]|uniref:VRR-NUC domain-containing protein n=1 Tax=Burkholderia sp. 9777_1386 TaxID=2751183 RepID=UPI0018C3B6E1|nr:VRR-NUC domain-containing protein [Burkholderia sp. 9777_1386]MBG0871431.1 VRR-NUC domain-containing protein [Burkholderia sp. 9777_1386]
MKKLSTLEHEIEDRLALGLAQAGHLCLKFISPGFPGVPDRIVLTTDGRVFFVECKAPNMPLRRTQPAVLELLRKMGHRVEVIDTFAQVEQILAEVRA